MTETRRALITGITGQDGSYLAEFLLEKGYEVHGMVRRSSTETFQRLQDCRDDLTLHTGDLLDQRSLVDVMRECEPHEIYNLAAMSFVAASWNQPVLTAEFSGVGVTRMLEAMREVVPEARFYQASSSEMFGQVLEVPQTETTPFYPRSPYGVAKVYGHFITVNYRESLRPFRLLRDTFQPRVAAPRARVRDPQGHPRRGLDQARAARTSWRSGNLDAERDWGYAKDYVEAMWLMLQQDEPEDFVIATGETHSVRELVDLAFEHVGLDPDDHVEIDPRFLRPAEVEQLIGDSGEGARAARLGAAHELRGAGEADGRRRPRAAGEWSAPEASRMTECDIAVVGAGIVGLAVARELGRRHPDARSRCSSASPRSRQHQTGNNSGVIHAGIYYKPGSLKARLCVEGAAEMYEFCEEHGVAHERCGKVIVALDDSELIRPGRAGAARARERRARPAEARRGRAA